MADLQQQARMRPGAMIEVNDPRVYQTPPTPATLGMTMSQVLDALRQCHAIADRLEVQIHGPHPAGTAEKEGEPNGVADQAFRARTALMLLAERLDKLSNAL